MSLDEFNFDGVPEEVDSSGRPLTRRSAWDDPCGLTWGMVFKTYIALALGAFVIGISIGVLVR